MLHAWLPAWEVTALSKTPQHLMTKIVSLKLHYSINVSSEPAIILAIHWRHPKICCLWHALMSCASIICAPNASHNDRRCDSPPLRRRAPTHIQCATRSHRHGQLLSMISTSLLPPTNPATLHCGFFRLCCVLCRHVCCLVGSVPCVCLSVSYLPSCHFLPFPFASICNTHSIASFSSRQ
jgi:hypothetical protein